MYKNMFLLFVIIIFLTASVLAEPYYSSDIKKSGFGVVEITNTVTVYSEPDENAQKLLTLQVNNPTTNLTSMNEINYSEYFLAKVPPKNIAFLVVIDEQDDGWCYICYDQKKDLCGWIKSDTKKVQSWRQFYMNYGKKNGLYLFKDIPADERKLYAQPFEKKEDMKLVANYQHAYSIKLVYIKGNWMLVRVLDIGNNEKIGYLRWRTDDGKLLLFPRVK